MAYPTKPDNVKYLCGTLPSGKKVPSPATVEMPLAEKVPTAPTWLPNVHAKKEFQRLAAILHANRLLTEASVMPLAQLCAVYGKLVQLWSAGEAPSGHLLSQYRNLINDFGLTPVSQSKVRPGAGAGTGGNKFSDNGKRT